MTVVPETGDIKINGKPYRIVLETARFKDVIDFSPRAATPGGSILASELGLYQPLLQTDWRAGFGHHWYDEALGYMRTDGNIDTRHPGIAMMFTKHTSSDTVDARKEGFAIFNGTIYSYGFGGGGISGIRKFSGGVWADIAKAATGDYGTVNFALGAGNYLFVCPDGGRIEKISTGDVATVTGLDANAADYKWMVIHGGFVYAGVDGTNRVHYDDTADLSTLEGTTADPNAIYVGNPGYPTLGAVSIFGKLYVFKADGMWEIGEDNKARKILDYSQEASFTNFRSWAVHNSLLVFTIRDRVFQWNGARLVDITPSRITDTFPYTTYGQFDNFVAVGNFLYLTARTNEATYEEHLLCYDGTAWHKLDDSIADGTGGISAMGFDPTNNRLWYHVDATGDVTYYIPFQSLSDLPYADFPIMGTHSLISSRLDMGFRRVIKSMKSLVVETQNCGAGTYLNIYYSLDGGAWVLWDSVKTNGVIELTAPGGNKSVEANYINIRVDFITDTAAQSPILESLTVKFLMRPDELYGHSFDIVVGEGTIYGARQDARSVSKVIAELKAARSSKPTVEFIDPMGVSHDAYITAVQGRYVRRQATSSDGKANIEQVVSVNMVELS